MSKWSQWKKNIGESKPWHLLDPDRLIDNEDVVKERFNICKKCPELIAITNQCKKCGCLMNLKIKLEGAKCPVGKW